MRKLLIGILSVIVVDAFIFDFTLRIFPIANSKMILAVIGAIAYLLIGIRDKQPRMSLRVLISAFLAVLFSLWCYIAITLNNSNEREFVTYYASFATWVGGAFGVYSLLKVMHERVDLMLLTRLLAIVCISQCIIALLMHDIPTLKSFVNSTILQAHELYDSIGRLYGIACALDPAGIRFSAVQVLIAHQLAMEDRVRQNVGRSAFLFSCFLIITVIGSVISRTTLIGTALGLFYILVRNLFVQKGGLVSRRQLGLSLLLISLIGVAIAISVFFYNTSTGFHENLRFGFEGFFSWAETGEFRTGSTDHLQTMWVWPETRRGWTIGEGRLGVFQTNSDIGYCNYILYCGLVGLSIFSIYFLFNHFSLVRKFRHFIFAAILLTAVTFIVWAKVMTDIFLIDALLFCIDGDFDAEPELSA
jgi:hypothetical protein